MKPYSSAASVKSFVNRVKPGPSNLLGDKGYFLGQKQTCMEHSQNTLFPANCKMSHWGTCTLFTYADKTSLDDQTEESSLHCLSMKFFNSFSCMVMMV